MAGENEESAGLIYRQELPLRLAALEELPAVGASRPFTARNEMLLRASIALQDHHEFDSREGENQELLRLELKMDLVLNCLQQLLAESAPPPTLITLTPEGLSGRSSDGLTLPVPAGNGAESAGATPVRVELYINPVVPTPLVLFGTLQCDRQEAGSWQVAFEQLGELERTLLEKLIFRYHRQMVALGRDVSPG